MRKFNVALWLLTICAIMASCDKIDDNGGNNNNNNEEVVDFSSVLPGHWSNNDVEWPITQTIGIDYKGKGTIATQDLIQQEFGVAAYGTYKLDADKIVATYSDVSVNMEDDSKSYHGFTDGQTITITYSIVSCNGEEMKLSVRGETCTYTKYADIQ